jgi:hypothetical protein
MDDIVAYSDQVAQLLERKRTNLEQQGVKKLRDAFQAFQIYYENIFNIFIRKGLIQEDPYKYDEKISEVDTPSDEGFLDSEEQEKLNQRLSQYHTRLEFLNNYYEYSVDFLNLGRIKRIVKFLKYINWSQVSETSTSNTTRALAIRFSKIRHGSDAISTSIVNDSIGQIDKTVKIAFTALNELAAYQKEHYKLELRQRLIPRLGLSGPLSAEKIEAATVKAKPLFVSSLGANVPFFPDLVKETLIEDYTNEGGELKKQVLESLHIAEEKKAEKKKEDIYHSTLIQSIRYLASCNLQIEDALNKISDAHQLLENQALTLGRRVYRWLRKMLGKGEERKSYEIEYFDVTTSSTKTEKIVIQEFIEEVKKLIQLFAGFSNKVSQIYRKLENTPEEKIFNLLNQNLINLQIVQRRMNGLIEVFKTEMPKEKKAKVHGINMELTAIKNSIQKSNQKKHEYVAIKEEEEQMKRLGLKAEPTERTKNPGD